MKTTQFRNTFSKKLIEKYKEYWRVRGRETPDEEAEVELDRMADLFDVMKGFVIKNKNKKYGDNKMS